MTATIRDARPQDLALMVRWQMATISAFGCR